MGREPEAGQDHVDERQVLTELVGSETEQDHRQQGDGHAEDIGGLLADLASDPDPEGYGGNGDHQQGDHRQGGSALRPKDILVVINQHRLHDGDRGAVGEPGDQQGYEGLVGKNILKRIRYAFPFRLYREGRFPSGKEGESQGEGCQEAEDGSHADVAGGAGCEERHERERRPRPEDGADHRKTLLPPGDTRALVVVLADLRQHGIIRNIGERIYRAEEYISEHGPPKFARLGSDAGIAEHQYEGDPEGDGEEEDVGPAPTPASAGMV